MSDVFSYGVVLLELLTGRRSVDKSRPSREQNLVEWARPLLKDPHKLERIMDPRLEGQYSTEGARKAALLAYQCLSQHPKSRPTMTIVVRTLEPLLDANDIPSGPFVYVVPTEDQKKESGVLRDGHEGENESDIAKYENRDEQKDEDKKKKRCHRQRKGHRYRHGIKTLRSRAVYSDTALYKIHGTSLYCTKPEPLPERA